jgi:lipooligosaccharide transport system ATP-binding protein
MNIVTARGLIKDYNSLRAVDNIDFEILAGECFGFLGPNGAGKTTAMGMIYCFMPPTSGEIKVFGMDVTQSPSQIKTRIGVMPQDSSLDPDLSVYENLVVYARYFDILKKDSSPLAWELLDFVELREKADVNIKKLSGGMMRRLLLARALINKPELLILDEPTTGLDPHSRHAVWERLNQLKAKGITLILTTHYMPATLVSMHGGNLEDVYLKLTGRSLEG